MIVNKSLRGQLVTGGYLLQQSLVGLVINFDIVRAGAGFKVGDILSSQEYGIEMKVTSVDDDNGEAASM